MICIDNDMHCSWEIELRQRLEYLEVACLDEKARDTVGLGKTIRSAEAIFSVGTTETEVSEANMTKRSDIEQIIEGLRDP